MYFGLVCCPNHLTLGITIGVGSRCASRRRAVCSADPVGLPAAAGDRASLSRARSWAECVVRFRWRMYHAAWFDGMLNLRRYLGIHRRGNLGMVDRFTLGTTGELNVGLLRERPLTNQ